MLQISCCKIYKENMSLEMFCVFISVEVTCSVALSFLKTIS